MRGDRHRMRLYRQQGGRCYLCDQRMNQKAGCDANPDPRGVTLDHVIPKSKGGTNDASNIAAACFECNGSKSDLLPLDLTTPEGRDRALGLHMFLAAMATCQPIRKAPPVTPATLLTEAGWIRTRSGRWHHDQFPGTNDRRRLFTEADAYALLEASPRQTHDEQVSA